MVLNDASIYLIVLFVNQLHKIFWCSFKDPFCRIHGDHVIGWEQLSSLRGWPFTLYPKRALQRERCRNLGLRLLTIMWRACFLCHTQTVARKLSFDINLDFPCCFWENPLLKEEERTSPHASLPRSRCPHMDPWNQLQATVNWEEGKKRLGLKEVSMFKSVSKIAIARWSPTNSFARLRVMLNPGLGHQWTASQQISGQKDDTTTWRNF